MMELLICKRDHKPRTQGSTEMKKGDGSGGNYSST